VAYLYTPPQWRNPIILEGSLRVSIPTSYCVYRKNGVWTSTQSPGVGELDGADHMYYTPTIIDPSLVAELTAFGQGTITTV
jgi:hypothetical protein